MEFHRWVTKTAKEQQELAEIREEAERQQTQQDEIDNILSDYELSLQQQDTDCDLIEWTTI